MPLKRLEKALPEAMTIADAVRAMIEGDDRIRLPLCYDTIAGFDIFEHLEQCHRILERGYDSALEYGTQKSQKLAQQKLEAIEAAQTDAQLYREDLNNLADSNKPDFSPGSVSTNGIVASGDHRLVNRSFFVPWAYKAHKVDIHGFHARQEHTSAPAPSDDTSIPSTDEEGQQAVSQEYLLSGERLWQWVVGDQPEPRPQYSEGQILFLSIGWLLDVLLTKTNGEWRRIVTDEIDKTSTGFLINGRLNVAKLAEAIATQLPVDANNKDPIKTIEGHIKLMENSLMHGLDQILEISSRQARMARRTLYGLARAVYKVKSGQSLPDRRKVQYPQDFLGLVTQGLTMATPLTTIELERALEKALHITTGLYPTDLS